MARTIPLVPVLPAGVCESLRYSVRARGKRPKVTALDDRTLLVLERDNQRGDAAKTKTIVNDYLQREGQIDGVWMDAGATSVMGGAVSGFTKALAREREDALVRGELRPGGTEREWTDGGVLRMLRSRSLARLRHETVWDMQTHHVPRSEQPDVTKDPIELLRAEDVATRLVPVLDRSEYTPSSGVTTVSVEAGATSGWQGIVDLAIGIDTFGDSGKGDEVMVLPSGLKTHITSIFAKLSVRDRAQAVISAYESGLVEARWANSAGWT